jgi:hypothetical protein
MHMRATSGIVSLTTHVMLVAAALWGTTGVHPRAPQPPIIVDIGPGPVTKTGEPLPGAPLTGGDLPIPTIPDITLPNIPGGVVETPHFPVNPGSDPGPLLAAIPSGAGAPIASALADEPPVMLAGPAAAYPDLLRQAGIRGRVVLEAVIDTLGHVEPGSVVVVERAHPEFVASAQRSLVASLFRPARVMGHVVRVRVRLPFDFVLQHGRL